MKTENLFKYGAPLYNLKSTRAHSQSKPQSVGNANLTSLLTTGNLQALTQNRGSGYSDRESICSVSSAAGRVKRRSRNFSMKSSKGISKKSKTMDYTNYAYNEAVGRLKVMLADNSYVATPKVVGSASYLRNFNEDSGDNFSDNLSVIERPVFSDISKYLSPSQKSRMSTYRPKKSYTAGYLSASKENLASAPSTFPSNVPVTTMPTDSVQAPVEIFNFIEKQEDYIEQLEKESKYCRNELTNLLGKVKDVINENENLTENARSELAALGSGTAKPLAQQVPITTTSPSSDSDEHLIYAGRKTPSTPRKATLKVQPPRYASAPNIVYEARISELEAELMQANIDLKRVKTENDELKRKIAHTDPLSAVTTLGSVNCDTHRKQLELLQQDKSTLEESVRQLQRMLDDAKSQHHNSASSKRYISDLVQMERSQAELEVRHLRDELDRQHERVRELQHEMARRLADERASAERRYNSQVDQLGGDLSSQWEQVAKLQMDLERQKRYETDLKRDVANRNSQIEELKLELRGNRTTFLADMAQVNAEKQSLEQEITSLRLQLDRAARETKTEAARLNAEINSLRQRLDRGDADLLHSKREVLRLNDEIANLEKELAYGELKNEIRPTKKDLDKRISEMQDKHAETVNELEEMITSQKQLMDKLTNECKTLTGKLEDTTYKHKEEISALQSNLEYLSNRMLTNEEHMSKLDTTAHDYTSLGTGKAAYDYQPSTYGTTIEPIQSTPQLHNNADDDYKPSSSYGYEATTPSSEPTAPVPAAPAASASDILGVASNTNGNTAGGSTAATRKSSISNGNANLLPDSSHSYGLNDNDDENLKDNLGMGEKQQQQQQLQQELEQQHERQREREREERDRELQQLREQREKREREREREQTEQQQQQAQHNRRYSNAAEQQPLQQPQKQQQQQQQPQQQQQQQQLSDASVSNAGSANLAAYNTDYSAYDQQQYDASAYDPSAYAQQPYDAQQYGYDANAAYDYSGADYAQTGYQYDATPEATSAPADPTQPQTQQQGQYQSTERGGSDYRRSSPPTTLPANATSPTSAAAPATAATTAVSGAGASRSQPRSSSGAVGPTAASGALGGSRSTLPQQSAPAAAAKK
ncbi:calponin homology domain-containing protein DDB_G0272472-like isoform X2 [Drosophila nasuta]|uniref:calponin homology domain-containing protein DDB_G0272472-like isoform X2 n=1 Tax=Drosophila nasuta TaxID=42062 RepID=UPI00295F0AA9|nr:calponin homology domain-containing protein DDB_G0272472-like isoform X2 [Drosophila nasuta]